MLSKDILIQAEYAHEYVWEWDHSKLVPILWPNYAVSTAIVVTLQGQL